MAHATIDPTSPARGSVSLELTIGALPERVFDALVDPMQARQWFGDLSERLVEGGRATLDFGDGDFFTIDAVHLEPPSRVAYTWRFLGLSPRDAINWRIQPDDGGTRLTVVDTDPLRAPEWNETLREGWRDFTSRLERYLRTGRNTRYAWRSELDGGVEIGTGEAATRRLLEPEILPAWLPSGGAALANGASWDFNDGLAPARVQIEGVSYGREVRFDIRHPDWKTATEVSLSVRARGEGAMLTFTHYGWERISGADEYRKQQRRRFAALWIAALGRARTLATAVDASA